jgi:oligopeptide/dipeptide ABC transporter ATP-binding protein
LARLILLLERSDSGSILFQGQDLMTMRGEDLREMRRYMQIIFQDPFASLDSRMTVGDIIAEPLINYGFNHKDAQQRVSKVMELCGLSLSQIDRYPHEFSGGQRQRIAIARAIALYPAFIVADEPVSALDVSIQAQIINLLADLQAELSLTYLFISHDLSVVRHVSDRVAVMYFGSIVETGKVEEVYNCPLHPYTQVLLNSVPLLKPDMNGKSISAHLKGEVPSPLNPPTGCNFHTRCPIAQFPLCSTERPVLKEKSEGHYASCHYI